MSFSELFPYLFGTAFVAIVVWVAYGLATARSKSVTEVFPDEIFDSDEVDIVTDPTYRTLLVNINNEGK